MATINTVNFDDLFDFSPEPLELQSSPNPHPTNAATAAIPRSVVQTPNKTKVSARSSDSQTFGTPPVAVLKISDVIIDDLADTDLSIRCDFVPFSAS